MKRLTYYTTILLSLLIMATGCNKTAGNYYVRASVGGTAFDAEGLSQATFATATSAGLSSNVITGKTADGKLIQITIITYAGTPLAVGPTPINSSAANANYYPKGLDSVYVKAISGTVNLTQLVPNLVGTFSFLCSDSTNVTGGSFSVRVQ